MTISKALIILRESRKNIKINCDGHNREVTYKYKYNKSEFEAIAKK